MEIVVFIIGGTAYGLIEILYRGHTHWSMILTGGAVVCTLFILTPALSKLNLLLASFIGALIITAYEFAIGILVNRIYHLAVWDYSSERGNIMGQICPKFTLLWLGICLVFFTLIKYNKTIF